MVKNTNNATERMYTRKILHLAGSGTGKEEAECLDLAGKLGEKVVIHGAKPQNELAQIMKQSHVFILPSFYEGFGLVLLEAFACGCRLVATNLPGINEALGSMDTNYITLVDPPRLQNVEQPVKEDEKKFEDNLARAIRDQVAASQKEPDINLSALQDNISRFKWSGVFERVEDVYKKVIGD